MNVNIKLGWDHLLVSLGGCLTKICFPIESELSVTIPPSVLKTIGVSQAYTLKEAAQIYSQMLGADASYSDFEDACGTLYLKPLKDAYQATYGKPLPPLKNRIKVDFSAVDTVDAMTVLSNI